MKKLLSLSLMLSLGLATVTPALNAAQSQSVAESQANPADASGWQAAKKWWQAGRKMSALNPQEQRAFKSLMKKFTIRAIIAAIVAMLGVGAYKIRRSEQERKAEIAAANAQERAGRQVREERQRVYREEMETNLPSELNILVQRLLNKNFSSVRLKGNQQLPPTIQEGTLYASIRPEELFFVALRRYTDLVAFIDEFNRAADSTKNPIIDDAIRIVTEHVRTYPTKRHISPTILLEEFYSGFKFPVGPITKATRAGR